MAGRANWRLTLAEQSIAGAWAPDDAGWAVVVTTPDGLEHQRLTMKDGLWEALAKPGKRLKEVKARR